VIPRLSALLVLACAAAPCSPQASKPAVTAKLTAAQIMDRGGAALGPRSAWDKIRSTVTRATLTFKDTGARGDLLLKARRPGMFVIRQSVSGVGATEQGYDGKVGWSKDPIQGLRRLQGAELAARKRAAYFDAQFDWRKLYKKWELIGVRKVNGRDAYVVRLSPQIGRFTLEYHDTKTFRLVRTDMVTETPQGPLPMEIYPSDYRKVDGVLVPFVMRQRIHRPEGLVEITVRITSVRNNVPISDSEFRMPEK